MRIPVVRGLGAGCVLGLTLLTALPAFAAEKDELASAQRMLSQVQAALERARVAAVQADPSERGRFSSTMPALPPISRPSMPALTAIWNLRARNRVRVARWPAIIVGNAPDGHECGAGTGFQGGQRRR